MSNLLQSADNKSGTPDPFPANRIVIRVTESGVGGE